MLDSTPDAEQKFDVSRAAEYETQSRIALAGYDACHELAACMLAAVLGTGTAAHILAAGAGGGGKEIVVSAELEPGWRFAAVDPSPAMMGLTVERLKQRGLISHTEIYLGHVESLPVEADLTPQPSPYTDGLVSGWPTM